jgi:D-psicose/D-tagatose/L-ribulose 3-epimerase
MGPLENRSDEARMKNRNCDRDREDAGMPTFGICGPLSIVPAAKAAGWDYVEGSVQAILQGDTPDDQWTGLDQVKAAGMPVEAANVLVPGDLKMVGPAVDQPRIETYLSRIFPRAKQCGMKTLVFGSGVARMIPEGFDREEAKRQIVSFAKLAGRHASESGITLVFEPLNRGECNVINSVKEGAEFTEAVGHSSVRCLVDSYHFWLEKEPLSDLAAAMKVIRHVHVADEHGRETPGKAAIKSDYRAFFKTLKTGGYAGRISVEAPPFKADQYAETLAFLKREWSAA